MKKDTTRAGETSQEDAAILKSRQELVTEVEPFLDLDLAALRRRLVDSSTIERFRDIIQRGFDEDSAARGLPTALVQLLAEMRSELYYLKAAYVRSERHQEPPFEMPEVHLPAEMESPQVDVLTVDMRANLTGRNWHGTEADGRWGGPGEESSVMVPALSAGRYRMVLDVVDEIAPGLLDGMQLVLNGQPTAFLRENPGFPCAVTASMVVRPDFDLPFWSVKLRFTSTHLPADSDAADKRMLSVRVRTLSFARED